MLSGIPGFAGTISYFSLDLTEDLLARQFLLLGLEPPGGAPHAQP